MEQAKDLAQQFLSGRAKEAETGDKQRDADSGMWGAAAKLLRGHGGAAAEEAGTGNKPPGAAHQVDEGFVDALLDKFKRSEGKQFEGHEHEYDQLANMAQSLLGGGGGGGGGAIQRELLKAWVKQRLGA